jgi:hypothetical protein
MHDRVFLAGALADVLKDCFHIRLRQQLCQVINQPGDTVVQLIASNILE